MSTPLLDEYNRANGEAARARDSYLAAKQALQEAGARYDAAKADRNLALHTRHVAYTLYADACHAESCEAHTFDQWTIHGEPEGPLG